MGPGESYLLFGPEGFSLPPGLSSSVRIPTAPDLALHGRLRLLSSPLWASVSPPNMFKFLPCLCPVQLLVGLYSSSPHKAVRLTIALGF